MRVNRIVFLVIVITVSFSVFVQANAEIFSGIVEPRYTSIVYAPIGGLVDNVAVIAGQYINAGDLIATFSTNKVFASQPGKVTAVFGEVGDSIVALDSKYGGVLCMEPKSRYLLTASTSKAYDNEANKTVHVGEKVYLSCYSDGMHKGEGTIISISGASYTVDVTDGTFKLNETVTVFRSDKYANVDRVGRGIISRTPPIFISGSGSIVSIHAEAGDTISKGDLLFETLDGEFDNHISTGNQLISTVTGIIGAVNISVGESIAKNKAVIDVYENEAMWVAAKVPEADLSSIKPGDTVDIEFAWNDKVTVKGTVLWISSVGTLDAVSDVMYYLAYISFPVNAGVRNGLSVTVSTLENTTAPDIKTDDTGNAAVNGH